MSTSFDPVTALLGMIRDAAREGAAEALAKHATSAPTTAVLSDKATVAANLGVSPATVDRYVARGLIPCVRLGAGGPRRFVLAEVIAALATTAEPSRSTMGAKSEATGTSGIKLLSRRTR